MGRGHSQYEWQVVKLLLNLNQSEQTQTLRQTHDTQTQTLIQTHDTQT